MSIVNATAETAPSARLTLVGAASPPALDPSATPVVLIDAPDPVLAVGLQTQLEQGGLRVVAGDELSATVAIVIADDLDDATVGRVHTLIEARDLAVVLVVTRLDPGTLAAIVEVGPCAVIMRHEATAGRLAEAVRSAGRGEVALPPVVMRYLLDQARGRSLDPQALGHASPSARERAVLTLIADGRSTLEVARALSYSERTIKNVLQDVSTRLQLRNRTHLVAYAIRNGWI